MSTDEHVTVTEETVVVIRMREEARERRDRLIADGRCLGCEESCEGRQVRCGLCPACYQMALKAIRLGKVERKDLVREGRMLPKRAGGRKPDNKFRQKLSELISEQ